jgi:hypothetical protein
MPLLDHFRPPIAPARQWGGFHSAWASMITHQLNEVLPGDYYARWSIGLSDQEANIIWRYGMSLWLSTTSYLSRRSGLT